MTAIQLTQLLPGLRRSQYFNEQEAFMQPLAGAYDGMHRTFRTDNAPLIYDPGAAWGAAATVVVYDATETVINPNLYTLASTKTGAIQFVTAPTVTGNPPPPFYASYRWGDLDLLDLWGALRQGFDEMESRFYRGFQLVPVGSSTTPVPGQLDLAITDGAGADPSGPSGTFFSTSAVQLDFLGICTVYRLARDYFFSAGKTGYGYREGSKGMEINPLGALKAQEAHLKELATRILMAQDQARAEWDSANNGLGNAVFNPMTRGYQSWFQWQGMALQPTAFGGFLGR